MDANVIGTGVQKTIGNSVANLGSSTATTADSSGPGFYNVPVTSFYFTPTSVPEPGPMVLAAANAAMEFATLNLPINGTRTR